MIAELKLDADGLPVWAVFDENTLVRYYDGELSAKEVTKAIWDDFGDDLAVSTWISKE